MSMANQGIPVWAWEVVTTTPGVGPDVMGRNVPGHLVNARLLSNGAAFQVFVPNTDVTNVDKVKADITARAQAIADLSTLRSHPA